MESLMRLILAVFWPLSGFRGHTWLNFNLYDFVVLAAFLNTVMRIASRRSWDDLKTTYDPAIIAWLCVCIISGMCSYPANSFVAIKELTLNVMIFYVFLKSQASPDRKVLQGLFFSLLSLSLFGLGKYVFQYIHHASDPVRACSFFPSPNLLGAALVLTLPVVLLYREKNKEEKFWKVSLLILMGLTLVLTFSRSSLLALIAVSLLYCLVVEKKPRWAMLLLIFYGLCFLLVVLLPSGALQERLLNLVTARWDFYTLMRCDIWKSSISMWLSSPLIGIGPREFHLLYPRYALPGPGSYYLYQPHAHNIFLQVLVETGILGLLFWGWVMALIVRDSYRNAKGVGGLRKDIRAGFFLALAAFFVQGLFDYTLWFAPLGFLFFIISGISCAGKEGENGAV